MSTVTYWRVYGWVMGGGGYYWRWRRTRRRRG